MQTQFVKTKEPGNKREQILLAAVEKFLDKDFYQVTVVEIAEQAGVGKGTVYEYFSSKKDLFKECFSYCADFYLQSFRQYLLKPQSVRKSMEDVIFAHLELIKDNRKRLHLLYNERPVYFQELQGWIIGRRQELLQEVIGLLEEGIRLKEVRSDINLEMAGRLFLSLTYVVMGGMIIIDNLELNQDQVSGLIDLYWHGIGTEK
ncbi:MAG: TetR/AcrR family transcriptional regulator [Firmicutes bacterium]|nr:TetR/AcrR family transcriptional regulator [Bacillota bacterium]